MYQKRKKNDYEHKNFTTLPQDAKNIRIEVFMKEQGFENEFDEIDNLCHHIVAFDEGKPIGTCRFFKENNHGSLTPLFTTDFKHSA